MPSDEELAKEFLSRLIDMRLQLQEADREKIIVDEVEVDEELAARLKRLPGSPDPAAVRGGPEGSGHVAWTPSGGESAKDYALGKVVRRKVTLRVSVNDQEITQYLEQNRGKLEQGLPYHARNILIVPDGRRPSDAAWEGGSHPRRCHSPADRGGRRLRGDGPPALAGRQRQGRRRPGHAQARRAGRRHRERDSQADAAGRSPNRTARPWATTSSSSRARRRWKARDSSARASRSVTSSSARSTRRASTPG